MEGKVILGIDPGTIITGYGVIRGQKALDFGCIRPPAKLPLEKRYLIIFNSLEELITQYKPHALAVETQFVKDNPQTAIKLGMARGMVLLAAAKNDIPIFEYSPRKAKQAVTGNGGACKAQVQQMVRLILNLSCLPEPEDAADALALALCHQQNYLKGKTYV